MARETNIVDLKDFGHRDSLKCKMAMTFDEGKWYICTTNLVPALPECIYVVRERYAFFGIKGDIGIRYARRDQLGTIIGGLADTWVAAVESCFGEAAGLPKES